MQQLELIKKKYSQQPNEGEAYSKNRYEILCKYCGERHDREKIIALPSVRHAPFAKEKKSRPEGVQIQKKNVEELKDTQVDRGVVEIFTLNTPTKTREKVEINGKYFHMQIDTGSLIPVNFLLDLGKPMPEKSTLQLKQFDGTIIKTLGTVKGAFETLILYVLQS